jgi:hypothetical protein
MRRHALLSLVALLTLLIAPSPSPAIFNGHDNFAYRLTSGDAHPPDAASRDPTSFAGRVLPIEIRRTRFTEQERPLSVLQTKPSADAISYPVYAEAADLDKLTSELDAKLAAGRDL